MSHHDPQVADDSVGQKGSLLAPRERHNWIPRVEALQWIAGVYFLILGMSLLILPHTPLSAGDELSWLWRGACSVIGGLALFWAACTSPPKSWAIALHLLASLPQLFFAIEYLIAGSFSPGATLAAFALGILFAPFVPSARLGELERPDLLGLVLGASAAASGLDVLANPASATASVIVCSGFAPMTVGSAFLFGGISVMLVQFAPRTPSGVRWGLHLFCGAVVLWVMVLACSLNSILWLLGASTLLRGIATAILPWLSERTATVDSRSFRVRLVVAMITVSIVPLLVTLPFLIGAFDTADSSSTQVRQLAFGVTLLAAIGSAILGWGLANLLARPLAFLLHGVNRTAREGHGVSLARQGPTEVVQLAAAVEAMANALRESRARLDYALEKSGTGGWDLDLVDHTAFRTLEHDRIFGYDALLPQWTYEMFLDHVLPEDRAEVDRRLREAMATQTDWNFECRIRHADGQVRWIWAVGGQLHDPSGQARRMSGIVQDITDRKQAEEALREAMHALLDSQTRFQALVESTGDHIWEIDVRGVYTYCSPQIKTLWGFDPKEMVGKSPFDLLPPEDREQATRRFSALVSSGTGFQNLQVRSYDAIGRIRLLEISGVPFCDAAGAPKGFRGITRDITERKLAEQAVEENKQKLSEILESIQDGFYALDREWRFAYINSRAAANVRSTPQELIGRNLWETFPAIIGTAHETYYRRAMDQRVPIHFETDGVLTSGSYDIRVYPSVDGISVYWLDITERKRDEERVQKLNRELERQKVELESANKELESFAYSVSHDLRAPLASIDGFSNMILKDHAAPLPPETTALLKLVQRNAQEMGRLTEALLLLSRTTRHALTRQTVGPRKLAEDVLEMLQPQLQGRQVEIIVQDLPECQADPVLLRQVYANLLSNAIKFTRECPNANIQVGYQIDHGETVYFVKDNGVGFDKAQAGNLFGVFQRLHSEDEYEGTGVGLAIVQRIVRRHGGRVWAEGKVGKGATFYFTIG